MTVCIAAMCDNGRRVVCCTDGAVTTSEITQDVDMFKVRWYGRDDSDLTFLFAGILGQADSIIDKFIDSFSPKDLTNRQQVQSALKAAYNARYEEWVAERILFPWAYDLAAFKRPKAVEFFGAAKHQELVREIERITNEEFLEQVLMIGWGFKPHSAMIYQVGRFGASTHTSVGWAAIGSGLVVASSTLNLLGQHRTATLEDTLYAVAAAKFSAERAQGVGQTSIHMCVSWKKVPGDECRYHLDDDDLAILRKLWEQYGKPRIPVEVAHELRDMVRKADSEISFRSAIRAATKKASSSPSSNEP